MKPFEVWEKNTLVYISSWDSLMDANQDRDRLANKHPEGDFFVKKVPE
jgi:hypothetical protein